MKIQLLIDNLGSGGAQRQLVGLAAMLKDAGYDVKVATYYSHDFFKEYLDENNVPNEIIPGADNARKRILAVRKYFKKEHPDWVIAYQETPSLVACAAKMLGLKYRLIVSERNTTQIVGNNERVRFFLYHWADVIVPNSYAQEKYLQEHHPWMKSKLKTITNFVDLDKFSFTEHAKRETPEIIIPASLMTSKNGLGFLNACSILKDRGIKFHAIWSGISPDWKDYYNRCVELIKDKNLEQYVDIEEKTKEIDAKYREADFLCLPSFYEGTPNVICEAMASGLPVICSDVCDNPRYVHEGENGFLFDPNKPEEIAEKIKAALKLTESDYQSYCQKSRKIAEEMLSEDIFINKYLNIINSK